MNLLFEDAQVFKKFVDGISSLVDEAEFVLDDSGLSLKATDPSQISLVSFFLPKDSFKEFDVSGSFKLGVDLNYFGQVLARARSGDSLKLSVPDSGSRLLVAFSGASKSSKRSFWIPLLDLASTDLPVPKIEYDSFVKILASSLLDSFKDASLVSTHVSLCVLNDSFVVKANSSKGDLESVFSENDGSLVSLKSNGDTSAMFPLDYLVNILKASSSDTEVEVRLKTDAPVEIVYVVGGSGKFDYFLAPRIERKED